MIFVILIAVLHLLLNGVIDVQLQNNYVCGAEDDDISCSDGNAEITPVNIGNDVSGSDQFACLVNGGTGSPNYNEYDLIDGALDDLEHLKEEICEELTPEQTLEPTRMCIIHLSDKFYHS